MIVDVLENADRYITLNKGFREGFAFLMRSDLKKLETGRHDIYTDRVFALVEDEGGRRREDAKLEAHEKYIDIQLVVEGTDTMGWKLRSSCTQAGNYDPARDLQYFDDEPESWLPVATRMFAIFFPEDAHMPMISPGRLRKVVVKIAVDQ